MNKELHWGISTWQLFHVLIEKITDDFYLAKKYEIFNIIKTICYDLPCLVCAGHAKRYINSVSIHKLKTRNDLRRMLYDFHNMVNIKIGKPNFEFQKLQLYKHYNLGIVLNNFSIFYGKRYNGVLQVGLKSNEMDRKRLASKILNWFKLHWKNFN